MRFFGREQDSDRRARLGAAGRARQMPRARAPRGAGHAAEGAFPRASRPRSSAWAASGAPSGFSGRPRACTRPPSATPAAAPRTPPTRRPAAAAPATPRSCWSPSTPPDELPGDAAPVLGGPRPDAGHAPGQRRRHPVPLAADVERRRPARCGRGLAARLPADALGGRPRHDHHRVARGAAHPSTTPRPTTSSTSSRTPAATAAWAAPASPAPSASRSKHRPFRPHRGRLSCGRSGSSPERRRSIVVVPAMSRCARRTRRRRYALGGLRARCRSGRRRRCRRGRSSRRGSWRGTAGGSPRRSRTGAGARRRSRS